MCFLPFLFFTHQIYLTQRMLMLNRQVEWKIFRRITFANFKNETGATVLCNLLTSDTLSAGFPNLEKLHLFFQLQQQQLRSVI